MTDRRFSLDLYSGTVLGSSRTIGMGGAVVALAEQALGMGANPAAVAARDATANDRFEWDGTLDWLNPDFGEDFDNDGKDDGGGGVVLATGGLAFEIGPWGIGLDFTAAVRTLETREISGGVAHLLVARTFAGGALAVGLGLRAGLFSIGERDADDDLVDSSSVSANAGVLWRPRDLDLRVGGSFALPVSAGVAACDACGSLVLPEEARLPWELAAGVGWRFGPTPWNQPVTTEFRDERALILAADLVLVGALGGAYGLQRWLDGELQRSGADVAVSVRGGGEFEWIPGWLRVRAGAYWEPARLEATRGRAHATFGVEVRVLSFRAFGDGYRIRLSLTGDAARKYGNGGLSIGFW